MSLLKQAPKVSYDYLVPQIQTMDSTFSTYIPKSIGKIKNLYPKEPAPNVSDFIFGDSDDEQMPKLQLRSKSTKGLLRQDPSKLKPVNVKRDSQRSRQKLRPRVNKNNLLDVDANHLFDNFERIFSIRFISDEEYARINSSTQQRSLSRDLKADFAKEEKKETATSSMRFTPLQKAATSFIDARRGESTDRCLKSHYSNICYMEPIIDTPPQATIESQFYFPQKVLRQSNEELSKRSRDINPMSLILSEKSLRDPELSERDINVAHLTKRTLTNGDYYEDEKPLMSTKRSRKTIGENTNRGKELLPVGPKSTNKRREKSAGSVKSGLRNKKNLIIDEFRAQRILQDITNYDRKEGKDYSMFAVPREKATKTSKTLKKKVLLCKNEKTLRPTTVSVEKRGQSEDNNNNNYSEKILKKLQNIIIGTNSQKSLARVESQTKLNIKEKPSFSKERVSIKTAEQRENSKPKAAKPLKPQASDYYQYIKGNNSKQQTTEQIYNGGYQKVSKNSGNSNNVISAYFSILSHHQGSQQGGAQKRAVSVPKR